jgi:hypothetical protein
MNAYIDAMNERPLGEAGLFEAALNAQINASYGDPDAAARWAVAQNAQRFDGIIAQRGKNAFRRDSFLTVDNVRRDDSSTAGFHLARQLEYVHAQVMETPLPDMSAFRVFPISSEVPPGARTHTVRRVSQTGQAQVYRGGQNVPRVGVSQASAEFPVRHYVAAYEIDLFEQQSSDYAKTQLLMRLARGCRDAIMRLTNKFTWHGSEENGIYGVLNYPWLAKKVATTVFNSAASADDVIAEIVSAWNYPAETSDGVYKPNAVAISRHVWNYLATKRMGTTSSGTIETAIDYLKRTLAGFGGRIEICDELNGAGPGGTHGVLMYRDDSYGVENVIVAPPTPLPMQAIGFANTTHMYGSHGGVVMREVGNNILLWVEVS